MTLNVIDELRLYFLCLSRYFFVQTKCIFFFYLLFKFFFWATVWVKFPHCGISKDRILCLYVLFISMVSTYCIGVTELNGWTRGRELFFASWVDQALFPGLGRAAVTKKHNRRNKKKKKNLSSKPLRSYNLQFYVPSSFCLFSSFSSFCLSSFCLSSSFHPHCLKMSFQTRRRMNPDRQAKDKH